MAGIIRQRSPRAGDGGMMHDPVPCTPGLSMLNCLQDWHINRQSTARRMEEINDSAGFIAKETTLTTVLRGFHYKADRAERRRAWHVSEKVSPRSNSS